MSGIVVITARASEQQDFHAVSGEVISRGGRGWLLTQLRDIPPICSRKRGRMWPSSIAFSDSWSLNTHLVCSCVREADKIFEVVEESWHGHGNKMSELCSKNQSGAVGQKKARTNSGSDACLAGA